VFETIVGEHRYKTDPALTPLNRESARTVCKGWGMDLAYIPGGRFDGRAKQLWDALVAVMGVRTYWLGLTDIVTLGNWVWADGTYYGTAAALCQGKSYDWVRCGTLWYGDYCGQQCSSTHDGFVCSAPGVCVAGAPPARTQPAPGHSVHCLADAVECCPCSCTLVA
jgi:hypothetical protein